MLQDRWVLQEGRWVLQDRSVGFHLWIALEQASRQATESSRKPPVLPCLWAPGPADSLPVWLWGDPRCLATIADMKPTRAAFQALGPALLP